MTEPKRLFDCLEYLMERPHKPDMLAAKENSTWKTYSTSEVNSLVNNLAAGLLNIGIGYGDGSPLGRSKVAVLSKNRPEWLILDLAVQRAGAILAPVYPTINVNELEFVLNDAEVQVVFVNDEETFHKVLSVKDKTPSIREIYTFEHVVNARRWKEILVEPDEEMTSRMKQIADRISYEDLVTIIYTSGTTGTPKGVMLSHKNILSNVMASIPCLPPAT